ncbi:MAG TPA: hypothetical protein VMV41_00105 [Cellulomonadaceae bacterium]|nr:hypothetical protein [Cellulomonadaceae bacterium]
MSEPFTTDSDVEHRVITHANGDRTIVDISVTDEDAAQLAGLSGDEVTAAIAAKQAEADKAAADKARADATQAVISDPPAPLTASTSAAGLAGPDPVTQGGTGVGEAGAGNVFPTTVPAPGTQDAASVKATAAADPAAGVAAAPQPEGSSTTATPTGPADSSSTSPASTSSSTSSAPTSSGPNY